MTFKYCGLGSIAFPENVGCDTVPVWVAWVPVNAGAELVPAGVNVWVWVPIAVPVKVSAGTVWVWVAKADPVNVGVCAIAFATPPVVLESAPVVRALIVPAGVPHSLRQLWLFRLFLRECLH